MATDLPSATSALTLDVSLPDIASSLSLSVTQIFSLSSSVRFRAVISSVIAFILVVTLVFFVARFEAFTHTVEGFVPSLTLYAVL